MTSRLAILSLFAGLLCGCATKQVKPANVGVLSRALSVPTELVLPAFDYSKATTNTIWWREHSSDLISWSADAGPYRGLPDGRTDDVISNDKMFYRMRGYNP